MSPIDSPRARLDALTDRGVLFAETTDVAAVMSMSPWSVQNAVREGKFPIQPVKIGRRLRFRLADLQALVSDAAKVGGEA